MKYQKGMMLALMLILSLGALSINAIFNSNSMAVGVHDSGFELREEFELAYTPHDAIWIQNNSDMIDQADDESWPGDGSKETPYVIAGYSFNQDTQPLRIWNTNLYWIFTGNLVDSDGAGQQCGTWLTNIQNAVITGNTFRNRHSGMYMYSLTNVNITDNEIYSNIGYGMEFASWISDCNVSGNTIYECNDGGIKIPGGVFNSTIVGNTISDCGGLSISLLGAVENSIISENRVERAEATGMIVSMVTDSILSFNTIINSTCSGMQIIGSSSTQIVNNTITGSGNEGIYATNFNMTAIHYNTISDCNGLGIEVGSGVDSTVCWNTVERSTGYALELGDGTEFFEVKYNIFDDNGDGCQICDHGDTNDISFNYYSDWTSPDSDANGIVDNPYAADGSVGNEDQYPLTEAGVVPEIEEPTTSPSEPNPISMELVALGAGAVLVIVIISGAVMLRKR